MHTIRGFRIKRKVLQWRNFHRRQQGLNWPSYTAKVKSKLCGFARCLKRSAKAIGFSKPGSDYVRIGEEVEKNPVPKGHLAVYVGENDDDAYRVLVPVIYFNHPLFGDLLREAEKAYGFNYDGGIHVPCRISEFENVQTKINASGRCCGAGDGGDGFRTRRSWLRSL